MSQLTASQISNDVTACQKAIANASKDEAIMAALSKQGYNPAKMQKGLDAANALQTGQATTGTTLGEQAAATTTVVSSLKSARNELMLLRDKGRELYTSKDATPWAALKLEAEVPRGQNSFVTFGTDTVQNVLNNPALMIALEPEGYTKARLEEILAAVQAMASDDQDQEMSKGVRQKTTGTRDSAEATFLKWWTPFKKAARRLLTADQLTAIGLSGGS